MLCIALVSIIVAACSPSSGDVRSPGAASSSASRPEDSSAKPTPEGADATKSAAAGGRVQIAFGGDVHFTGSSAAALSGDVGTAVARLKAADLAVVNLETAVTDRGTPGPKEFTFRAPAKAMNVLRKSGIDVVTVANNHGMDYGRVGLADTLAAGRRYGMHVIGAGADVTAAYAPYRKTIRGVRVAIFGATDVLDDFAISTWPATESRSGLASAKDSDLLLAAVKSAAATSDVIVVDLHWGVELQSCPTARQRTLAAQLTKAGADIVVGSHAHVVEPHIRKGRTAIHYGLGNFIFYAKTGAATQSGVYTVTVNRRGVVGTKWSPATIRGGRPQLLTGSAAKAATERENRLADSCGVS